MQRKIAFSVLVFLLVLWGCRKDVDPPCEPDNQVQLVLPDTPYNYADLNLPDHVANNTQLNVYAANNIPSFNQTTDEGAALGRVLFYDRKLSADNTISCSSCHVQEKAFSDPRQFSVGIDGGVTQRNSMSLLNLRYFRDFFWDMRADGLEQQVLMPIVDPGEMNSEMDELLIELSETDYYADLFETAFGDPEITEQRISYALAQFIRAIVAFDAKFDQGVPSDFANFTPLEADGMELFYSGEIRCNHCHASYNFFTRLEPAMTGLESMVVDSGFYAETANPDHIGAFKIVSLRNIEVTAPYMHDGRFSTLEEVIEQYDSGIQSHANLDSRLTVEEEHGGTPLVMNMTEYEKESLVAFLKTLTDHEVMHDIRFSDPFHY